MIVGWPCSVASDSQLSSRIWCKRVSDRVAYALLGCGRGGGSRWPGRPARHCVPATRPVASYPATPRPGPAPEIDLDGDGGKRHHGARNLERRHRAATPGPTSVSAAASDSRRRLAALGTYAHAARAGAVSTETRRIPGR